MSQKLLRILIPVCMVLGIATLWYLNNAEEMNSSEAPLDGTPQSSFALKSTTIDLPALKNLKVPMIIDFGADACIPCKEMAPVLVKLNAEMQNKAVIKFVDVWKSPQGAEGFPVQVIPTQVIYQADGNPYVPKNVKDIQFLTYYHKDSNEHIFTVHQGGLTEDQMRRILKDMGTE